MTKQMPTKNSLLLLLTAVIWGTAFVAQQVGMDHVGPFAFSAARFILGGITLLPVLWLLRKKNKIGQEEEKHKKDTWVGGFFCGIVLFLAGNLQQIGIQYTTVGKAGFITALYIVIVPIIGIFFKKRVGVKLWGSVAIACIGLYLLCMTDRLTLALGDSLVFLSAIVFSIHILVIDHYSPKADGVKMSCIQFFIAGVLSLICMPVFEIIPSLENVGSAWLPILYAGVLSSGVAYTLQIAGQKNVNPTIASLIFSLEAVISVIAAWIILGQIMSTKEIIGALFMFIAIILAQIPSRGEKVSTYPDLTEEASPENGKA